MELTKLTFAMIKPDAVAAKNSGKIIDMIENNGFEIVRLQRVIIASDLAHEFYGVHKERPFFGELVEFVTSAPVIIMALHKDDAINSWRELIGATDPSKAAEGTIRQKFGTSIGNNAVHGSDSSATAVTELELFFPDLFEYEAPSSACSDEESCEEGSCDDESCDDQE